MEQDIEQMRTLRDYGSDSVELTEMSTIVSPAIPAGLTGADYWNRFSAMQTLIETITDDGDVRADITVNAILTISIVLCRAYAGRALDQIEAAGVALEPL